MLTLFGKFCRKLRIDRGELLKDMSDKLGVTPSYLSAVENGKRNIPPEWVFKISELYSLNEEEVSELKAAADTQINTRIDLNKMKGDQRDVMMAFARDFDQLNEAELDVIKNILFKKKS